MKKKFPLKSSPLILLMFFIFSIQSDTLAAPCGTTVLWHNRSDGPGGFDSGITQNVYNQNIDVIGTNALVDGIEVVAQTCDILITVTNGDAVITGSGNRADHVLTNSARLYLFADTGRTITFQLNFDLLFRGTANGTTLLDLMVTVSGGGEVIFQLADNKKVSFTSIPGSGGTQVFVVMNDSPNSPTLIFERANGSSSNNVEVVVGGRSQVSYISSAGITQTGTIIFEPANTGLGGTILRLSDTSAFVIFGHQLNAPLNSKFLLGDIDLSTPAGGVATFEVLNTNIGGGAFAAVQIINMNNILTRYLIDPFCEGPFTGQQFGFILGPSSNLIVPDQTYIDYIGTRTNGTPTVSTPLANLQPDIRDQIEDGLASGPGDYIKERNPSAFIVDGFDSLPPAMITMLGDSAIYFRSGCDEDGVINAPTFTIDPTEITRGMGNVVFDVEGPLNVQGDPNGHNVLNVLSLQVAPTGCPVVVESTGTNFPSRTFARDANGVYLRYNSGAWLINNRINLFDASILHTDENHLIFERDNLGRSDLNSEPTYVGGETFRLCEPPTPRPTIAFYNSIFRFSTGAGLTGVDILVPNLPLRDNFSIFRFYGNGRLIDDAYGRYVILGTVEGSFSAMGQLIDNDSHLNVFQESAQALPTAQQLTLDVGSNTTCITEGIVGDISNQYSVHTIFLGNTSNISIGTNGDVGTTFNGSTFALTTSPLFFILGDFMSFETHGGSLGLPETSGTTGQGGIFVDKQGTIAIDRLARANVSTMVTRSKNGVINLPKNQVYFHPRIGIAQWKINLTASDQRILIPANAELSDFTMDWGAVTKDYTSTNSFVPYELKFTPSPCDCPPVTDANLRALPVVQGEVDQFQILRSRIGDQAHLLVDGGFIRELVFLPNCNTAVAPVGFIVVQNNARVGLNTAHRTIDSLDATLKLGVNGVTLVANGDGTFIFNEDTLIDNVCHILTGTAFGVNQENTLILYASEPKELRVKSTGVLELESFKNSNQILEIAGQLKVIFEPGAQLIMGGGTLVFTDQTELSLQRVFNNNLLVGAVPSDLDPIRVKLVGTGNIVMQEDSSMLVQQDTFFGVETDSSCTSFTDITWTLRDQAKLEIGNDEEPGGAFQVGNAVHVPGATINFRLILNGIGTLFQINRQGFLGFGVGMVDKLSVIPNEWVVGCLDNVTTVSIAVLQGTFRHNQIFTGDSELASLMAIGPSNAYTFAYIPINTSVLGGGNLILVENCGPIVKQRAEAFAMMTDSKAQQLTLKTEALSNKTEDLLRRTEEMLRRSEDILNQMMMLRPMYRANVGIFDGVTLVPTVTNFAGQVSANLETGMLSSRPLLDDKFFQPSNVSPQTFFDYLKTVFVTPISPNGQITPKANIARNQLQTFTLGFITGGSLINRDPYFRILGGFAADPVSPLRSLELGAVMINIDDTTGDINEVIQLQQT